MEERRNDFDVTNRVNVTDSESVCNEVCKLFSDLYPDHSMRPVRKAFQIASELFRGDFPGYRPCDTPYHDLQHTLDVTLAMARLLSGHELSVGEDSKLGIDLIRLGIVVALFHDSGYVRRIGDRRNRNGAVYTNRHVSRGGHFLAAVLPQIEMAEMAPLARKLIHFTGYEMPVPSIPLHEPGQRTLGQLLGSADLMAQMSDRCYLEKCRDRLYPEFVAAGLAGNGVGGRGYDSAEALIFQSPKFFQHILDDRLDQVMGGVHSYAKLFFLPQKNYYQEALERNYDYLKRVVEKRDITLLRRKAPWTLVANPDDVLLVA
ncbi:MAG TPA: hypothetical protein VKA08_18795 [Balneolales bacterium]|nr:hypothetical protein [Balneolales bacterium]